MLWYLFGFALGCGVMGGLWFLLRKLGARFTFRGVEYLVSLLAVASLMAGCAASAQKAEPAGGRDARAPALAPVDPAALLGSAANPLHVRCAALDTLAAIATKATVAPSVNPVTPANPVPSVVSTPARPSGYPRLVGWLGVFCGVIGFSVAWWLYLKRSA